MSEYDAFARFYDLEYHGYTDDLEMYATLAGRAGSRVLELACGTGRIALHLARAGFQVTGLDVSSPMLAIARQRLAAEDPEVRGRVTLAAADMRRFRSRGPFDMALYAINSFMHLMTPLDQIRSLKCVARHLREGALLAIDLFNPDLAVYDSAGRMFYERTMSDEPAHSSVVKMVSTGVDRGAQVNRLTFYYDETGPDGSVRRTIAPITQRFLYRHEMEHLLQRTGFSIQEVLGDFRMKPFAPDSAKMIFVARRDGPPTTAEPTNTPQEAFPDV